jgi:hypothetical protein
MKRTDPTFKSQTITSEENNDFLDELFARLTDSDDVSCSYDEIPDLGTFDRAA